MFKNFFLLNRHVIEIDKILSGFTLRNVFTQEENKIIFSMQKASQELFIELNTDQSFPYFINRDKFNRAKKNTLDFFESFLPADIHFITIAEFERIIQFNLNSFSIYFYIRGKETNVFAVDQDKNLFTFKKIDDKQKLINVIDNLKFSKTFLTPEINLEDYDNSLYFLSKKYPYLGKEIISEFEKRILKNPLSNKQILLNNIFKEIENSKPFVFKDPLTHKYKLSFFHDDSITFQDLKLFENVNEAMKFLIAQNYKVEYQSDTSRDKENKIVKKLHYLERKQAHIQERLNEGCKDEKFMQIGNLLLMNLDKIYTGLKQIELENIYDLNKPIIIDLSPKLKPKENVERYFKKSKSERKEYTELKRLLSEIESEITKVKKNLLEVKIINASTNTDTSEIKSRSVKKSVKSTVSKLKSRFREFILHDKYFIYVGKNSKNNDELTTGFAKQNDYWFHARIVSGSHVVLRWDKSSGEIQKSLLEKAASIAAFYSKAKTSGLVPVSYTQKKYVIKRKGMEPGKVALLKEKVLIVRPEIPKDCKLITEE